MRQLHLRSSYSAAIEEAKPGIKVLVIEDLGSNHYMTVTNNIENICEYELGIRPGSKAEVKWAVYSDCEGTWNSFNIQTESWGVTVFESKEKVFETIPIS